MRRFALAVMSSLARAHRTPSAAAKVRAVALDLDGTLCRSDGGIGDATVRALVAFVERGGRAIIATGRGKSHAAGIAEACRERGLRFDALVCSDGAVAFARSGGDAFDDLLYENVAAGAEVAPVLRDLAAAAAPGATFGAEINAPSGVVVSHRRYFDVIERHNPNFFAKMLAGKDPSPDFDGAVLAAPRVNWIRCVGGGGDASGALLDAAKAAVADAGVDLRCAHSTLSLPGGPESVVLKPNVDKSVGLAAVAVRYGLDRAEIAAFGDAANDHEMLEWAGAAVCPSNATPDAKSRATFVSELSNDEDFIADALDRLPAFRGGGDGTAAPPR